MFCLLTFLWLLVISTNHHVLTLICSRYPANTYTPKSPVDENFVVSVSGNPQHYILGQTYNVSLNAFNGLRFISFTLALENANGDSGFNGELGYFEIIDDVETRYSPNCINMVESTNSNPKTRVDIAWTAPTQPGSGCVLIRATVLQHRDVWYMDDGGLTKRICEEVVDDVESQPRMIAIEKPCCACDEARYELTFEAVWSRNLHPKNFPQKGWITRFSDIVGAAHTADYRFWEYGLLATEAMREFAEHGAARALEQEFKDNYKDGKIRTIIKARGPAFPNLNSQSIASVRVDPQHHLISLATKIDPSPDWIVGIAGMELCMTNCTWLEQKVINLYPWDIGTDAGPTYTAADQPQVPPDVIRRMRSDFPNDPRSPFFDPTGAPMKPLATLTVKRQRLYERLCDDEESNNINNPRECVTHPWTAWSTCTSACGEGRQFRTRVFKQPEVAKIYKCDEMLTNRQYRACQGDHCKDAEWESSFNREHASGYDNNMLERRLDAVPSTPECQSFQWGAWSACNSTCGEGSMLRHRQYLNPVAATNCQQSTTEYKKCFGRTCANVDHSRYAQEGTVFGDDNNDRDTAEFELDNRRGDQYTLNGKNAAWYTDGRLNSFGNMDDKYAAEPQTNTNVNGYTNSNNDFNLEVGNLYSGDYQPEFQKMSNYLGMPKYENKPAADIVSRRPLCTVPAYCFRPLQMYNCLDDTVIGNNWFYNFCTDECMIYAVDSCDRNVNKFSSLEMCELRCRATDNVPYLRSKQLEECLSTETAQRSRQRNKQRKKQRQLERN